MPRVWWACDGPLRSLGKGLVAPATGRASHSLSLQELPEPQGASSPKISQFPRAASFGMDGFESIEVQRGVTLGSSPVPELPWGWRRLSLGIPVGLPSAHSHVLDVLFTGLDLKATPSETSCLLTSQSLRHRQKRGLALQSAQSSCDENDISHHNSLAGHPRHSGAAVSGSRVSRPKETSFGETA